MRKKKGFTAISDFIVVGIVVLIFGTVGYIMNIVKLCRSDFEKPIKAEVIRGVGVVVPPVGAIAGYCTIQDSPKTHED